MHFNDAILLAADLFVQAWLPVLRQLVKEAANAVQPAAAAAFGENDPRFYVKVRMAVLPTAHGKADETDSLSQDIAMSIPQRRTCSAIAQMSAVPVPSRGV